MRYVHVSLLIGDSHQLDGTATWNTMAIPILQMSKARLTELSSMIVKL